MEKSISRKILVIGLVFLFLGASVTLGVSATGDSKQVPTNRVAWSDDFDTYTTGSALHGQGGWAGWDNDPAVTGYVTNVQSRSSPNSVEIDYFTTVAADMVQQYSDVNSGIWIYRAWQYVPGSMTGTQNFILMNTYVVGTHNNPDWSLQLEFSATGGYMRDANNVAATTTLITNAWVEIRVEINFETDLQTIYYNNNLLTSKSWKNGVSPGGAKNLACVDLYAGSATSSSVYYDDLSLSPPTPPLTCDAGGPYTGVTSEGIVFHGNASGGVPTYTWLWNFGDGNTSTLQNPVHSYSAPGLYNVTLMVTDSAKSTASDETIANITKAPTPEIVIEKISGGKGISVQITNNGTADATMVPWNISLNGGFIFKGKTKTGTIPQLNVGEKKTLTSSVLGFGKTTITVTVGDKEKKATGFIFLFFVLGVK